MTTDQPDLPPLHQRSIVRQQPEVERGRPALLGLETEALGPVQVVVDGTDAEGTSDPICVYLTLQRYGERQRSRYPEHRRGSERFLERRNQRPRVVDQYIRITEVLEGAIAGAVLGEFRMSVRAEREQTAFAVAEPGERSRARSWITSESIASASSEPTTSSPVHLVNRFATPP